MWFLEWRRVQGRKILGRCGSLCGRCARGSEDELDHGCSSDHLEGQNPHPAQKTTSSSLATLIRNDRVREEYGYSCSNYESQNPRPLAKGARRTGHPARGE